MLMNNKKVKLVIPIVTLIMLCGCSNSQSNYTAPPFSKDNGTLTKEEAVQYKSIVKTEDTNSWAENNYEQAQEYRYDAEHLGEIRLLNSDETTDYTVVGTDVVYNGKTYKWLLEPFDYITLPNGISQKTFINFIIKVLKPQGNVIEVNYDVQIPENGEEDTIMPLSEAFYGISDYDYYVNHYGSDVTWEIQLYDTDGAAVIQIYGCDKYMFMANATDMEFDMSAYVRSGSTVTEESTEESSNESSIEENTDTEEQNEESTEETEGNTEASTEVSIEEVIIDEEINNENN